MLLLLWMVVQVDQVESLYLKGLADARAAFEHGAPPESLEPVRAAIVRLAQISGQRPGPAETARLTLQAAAAGAQSEREEMALYLDAALRMERLLFEAGQPGAPGISAHEVAGDLWLQVFRYDEAARAYMRAAEYVGMTPRIKEKLTRAATRLEQSKPPR